MHNFQYKFFFTVSSRHNASSDTKDNSNKDNNTNSNKNAQFRVHSYNNVCSNSIDDAENASLECVKT